MAGHKINIKSPMAAYKAEILIDEQTFKGVRALDVRMRVDEVVTITTEILPQEVELEYNDADVFIHIGDKKYRLMECIEECNHEESDITAFCDMKKTITCNKCGKVF